MEDINILIIEDEAIIALSIEKMLNELGYRQVVRCKDHIQGKQLIKSQAYGLVLLDINLAGNYEGLALGSVCEELSIPFLFLTSYSDRETFSQAKITKPGGYVIKPFDKNELMVAVELTLMDSTTEAQKKINKAVEVFKISKRESDILKLAYRKIPNHEICEKLSLSLNTVKYHLRHIYNKMAASSKDELIERINRTWQP